MRLVIPALIFCPTRTGPTPSGGVPAEDPLFIDEDNPEHTKTDA
jgi:hypothetical protein